MVVNKTLQRSCKLLCEASILSHFYCWKTIDWLHENTQKKFEFKHNENIKIM